VSEGFRLPGVARITITVAPGARRSELTGRHGDGWKVRVAAVPERSRANEAVVNLLAEALRLPRERISVVAGRRGRRKVVEVEGRQPEEVARRLEAAAR
jgi:uncharacterized protein YggU (UPF0235/DUF167 family)